LENANVAIQQVSRPTLGNPFQDAVITMENGSRLAGRGLSSNTKTILELISSLTGWIRLEDTFVSNTRATVGADGCAQDTAMAIKLCAGRTALDMSRCPVFDRHNIIECIFANGGLTRESRLSLADRK
jgi:hypothetical protein